MIKFYRSNYDEFNPDTNGGDITDIEIESGVANSFIPAVRPREAEIGDTRYFKFFVKTDEDILTIGVDIAKYTDSPTEEIYFAKETKSDHSDFESDLDKDNLRLYGGFKITDVDVDNKQITSDRDVTNFVKKDDWVTIYDDSYSRITGMNVDNVSDDGLTITFKLWTDKTIDNTMTASSSIYVTTLNKDDYFGIWVKEPISPYTEAMEDPLNEMVLNVWYDKK